MNPFTIVVQSYAQAWSRRTVLVGFYLALRLAAWGVIAPVLAGLVNLAVSMSSQSALTDQDIARFILTPGGFVAAIAVLSILLVVEVLGFAIMTAIWRAQGADRWQSVRIAVFAVLRKARGLLVFSALLVLRVLALVLPFVIAGWLVARRYLGEFDINYYLTFRPPEAMVAAALLAVLALVLGLVLLSRLSAWAVSLHLVVFDDLAPGRAFGESARRMRGNRLRLQAEIVIWLAVRIVLAALIGLLAGWLLWLMPGFGVVGLRLALTVSLIVVALWVLAAQVLAALSLGALARLVNRFFDGGTVPEPVPGDGAASLRRPLALAGFGAAALAGFGFWAGAQLLDAVQSEDEIVIIAHRGAAGSRPENTMASMQKAIEDRTDWIEIDVQETADGRVVVLHDSDFMKLAGVDLKIRDATLADLADVDIGSWYDPAYAGERTPLLADVLELARDRARVLIELKYYGDDVDLEARVARIVDDLDMAGQIAVMSLKYPAVQKMQRLRPGWRTGVLAATAVGDLAGLQADFVAINTAMASPGLVRRMNAAGRDLYVWTVNDPLEMSRMISLGVDGLITDEPAMVREVLAVRAGLNTGERLVLWLSQELGLRLNRKEYRDNAP